MPSEPRFLSAGSSKNACLALVVGLVRKTSEKDASTWGVLGDCGPTVTVTPVLKGRVQSPCIGPTAALLASLCWQFGLRRKRSLVPGDTC